MKGIPAVSRFGLNFPTVMPPKVSSSSLRLPEGAPRFGIVTLNHTRIREIPLDGHGYSHQNPGAKFRHVTPTAGPANVAINFSDVADVPSAVVTALIDGHPETGEIMRGYRAMGVHAFHKEFPYSPRGLQYGRVYSALAWGSDGPSVQYNLANEVAAELKAGDFDWQEIFQDGAVYAHTDGIFLAVGKHSPDLILDFFKAAGERKINRSFDLNFRPGLLKDIYGEDYKTRAQEIYAQIVRNVEILEGNRDDLHDALGIPFPATTPKSKLDTDIYREMITETVKRFPNLKVVLANLALEKDASHHLWTALLYINGQFFEAPAEEVFVRDRIGRGDATTFGTLYSMMTGMSEQEIVDFAWAAGAKAMAAVADTIKVPLNDISKYAKGKRAGQNVSAVAR